VASASFVLDLAKLVNPEYHPNELLLEVHDLTDRKPPRTPDSEPPLLPDTARLAEMHAHAADAAQLLKALANEQRLLVLCNLLQEPLTVGELNERVDLSQSALSQHLALLRGAGLVETTRQAQSIRYSLPPGPVTRVIGLLQDIYCPPPAAPVGSRGKKTPTPACAGPDVPRLRKRSTSRA
jgi:DNA-binding transcriptional ArsR family regulator